MNPKQTIVATLGNGASTTQRLEHKVAECCNLTCEWAKVAVANALVELFKEGVVTMPVHNCYQLTGKHCTMEAKTAPTEKHVRGQIG